MPLDRLSQLLLAVLGELAGGVVLRGRGVLGDRVADDEELHP